MKDKFITQPKADKNEVLLVDWSNLSMRNLFVVPYDPTDNHFTQWKNMMLRSIRKLFTNHECGRVIFCMEGRNNWRKDYYPEYKANRLVAREASKIDFDTFFAEQDKFVKSLQELLTNCMFLKVDRAEADDLIAVITKKNQQWKVVNISSDRDFYQLYKYLNYKQYDSVKESWIEVLNPENYLLEKVILGDAGDNVPKLKAKVGPKTAAKIINSDEGLEEWLKLENLEKEFERNMNLISFDFIPEELQYTIQEKVEAWAGAKFNPKKIMDFLKENGCLGQFDMLGTFATLFQRFDVSVEE